jgi:hypothetical protein
LRLTSNPNQKQKIKMKHTKITSTMVALAIAAVLGTTTAHAQVTSYNEGDLLLGFEQQNGAGGVTANDYGVDLGAVSNFIGVTSPLTFDLSTTDLTLAFGSGWAGNTNLGSLVQWGVIGGSDENSTLAVGSDTLLKNTLFYTQGELNVGTQSTPPATASNSTQKNVNGNIQQFGLSFQGATESASAIALGSDAAIIASGTGWSEYTPSTEAFGGSKGIEQPSSGSDTGPTDSVLDLYELPNTTSTPGAKAILLGDFSLTSAGVLTFDPAAVPEPSSYALAALAAVTFVVLRRRKAISAQ